MRRSGRQICPFTFLSHCCTVQVEACRSGMLYVVNVVGKDGGVLSEVAFNSQTGCIGANTVQVAHRWSSLYIKYLCSTEVSRPDEVLGQLIISASDYTMLALCTQCNAHCFAFLSFPFGHKADAV